MKTLILTLFSLFAPAFSGVCEILAPSEEDLGQNAASTVGLIMVPGATIPGAAYLPLLETIQDMYPGPLWVGATEEWNNEFPNPIEIGAQVNECLFAADAQGLSTENVFFAGHSLGGIVLETYISGHADLAKGVILLGTWLPDLVGGSNDYPVPTLTAIGELDGGGLSYLRREAQETAALPAGETLSSTILVPRVNHAQVASGEVSEDIQDNDIDGELSEEEAHEQYAQRVGDWLTLVGESLGLEYSEEEIDSAKAHFHSYESETILFLEPFIKAFEYENGGLYSEFVQDAQMAILDLEDTSKVMVTNEVKTNKVVFETIAPWAQKSDGSVTVHTFTYFEYDSDALDYNNHLSASTVKAKMMVADSVYPMLGLPQRNTNLNCSTINQMSMDVALSLASGSAINRMQTRGRSLTFGEDDDSAFGDIGWEFDAGLVWSTAPDNDMDVTLTSIRNIAESAGNHYCDLLSPYRALEWIYIESIRHKMQF